MLQFNLYFNEHALKIPYTSASQHTRRNIDELSLHISGSRRIDTLREYPISYLRVPLPGVSLA